MKPHFLNNHFLIAMPALDDGGFTQSVTYLCQHNQEGALGLVINKPHDLKMSDIFEQLAITVSDDSISNQRIYMGGPVQPERGFVLHNSSEPWESTLSVDGALNLTTSKDIIEAIAKGEGPEKWMLTLGYAGWGAGQLEMEIQNNAWLHGIAQPDIIFDEPVENRWTRSANNIGVDLSLISHDAGHA